jgi:HAD superfamily hydrolase (TIGR01490 family)
VIAAFFDLDGTLSRVHVWQGLTRHHRQNRVMRLALWRFLIVHAPLYVGHGLHLVSKETAITAWARDMSWLVAGMPTSQAQAVFDWVADRQVAPSFRPDVVARLREHQASGHRVILVSGTLQPLLQTIAARLGVTECVGTLLEERGGRYTGRSLPPVCLGPGKVTRLRALLAFSSEPVDLAASFAYADSASDLPVLEMVGHPVAAYPDAGLRDLAIARGWPVIGDEGAEP